MKAYKIPVILALMVSLMSSVIFADSGALTRTSAIDKAIENSTQLLTQKNTVKKLEYDYNIALGESSRARDMLNMDRRMVELNTKQALTPEENMELTVLRRMLRRNLSDYEKYNLTMNQQTYADNIGYILDINKGTLKSIKNNIVLTMNELFNSLGKADSSIQSKKLLIYSLESNYNKAEAKYELGKISRYDLQLLGIKLQKEKIELKKLSFQRNIIINNIQRNIGEDPKTVYDEYIVEDAQAVSLEPVEDYIQAANENRNDVLSARKLFELRQKEYDITKIFFTETDQRQQETLLSMNEAKYDMESLWLDVQAEVNAAYKDVQKKLNELDAAELVLQVNESKYNEALKKYSLGLITDLEVANSNIDYVNSKIKYINTERDTWQSKLRLDYACGIELN